MALIKNMPELYFKWLYELVIKNEEGPYVQLLQKLYDTDYHYTMIRDGCRAEDGEQLRYRFGREHHLRDPEVAYYLDDRPCSVLEMMVALALRCEEEIMDDDDYGDRTYLWFYEMLQSLNLDLMADGNYDEVYVDARLDIFLNRLYEFNGDGGLFTVPGVKKDMRGIDIWYQLMAYLNYITED